MENLIISFNVVLPLFLCIALGYYLRRIGFVDGDTGDCTYIRYGTTDILIDCGSKSSSISYVSNYLNNYMQDDVIEYCIVTHAHTDHYAGFTTTKNSMFELFEYGTIIDFGGATNKDTSSGALKKYITNRNKVIVTLIYFC